MRTFNVRLAAILFVVAVVFCGGVYFLHGYQVHRNAYVFKVEADRQIEKMKQATDAGNVQEQGEAYRGAVRNLFWYVRLMPDDVDELEKLATLLADHVEDSQTFGRAFGWLERVVRQAPERDAARRRLVEMAMLAGRHQDAKDHLRFLIEKSPDDPELMGLLGRCNAGAGENRRAIENLTKAIELSPSQVEAYAQLANVLRYRLLRDREADEWMNKLVEANPDSAQAHLLRGFYLVRIQATDKALEEAKKSLELEPDGRDALWLAAECYSNARQYDDARDCATRGVALYPDNPNMYKTLANIELRSGDRDEAMAVLEQGLKATRRHPELLWAYANLLIDINRLEEGAQTIDELRNTRYPRQMADYLAARIDFAEERWLAACRKLEGARATLTRDSNILKRADVLMGECYGRMGNRDKQIEAYRRALVADPSYGPARAALTRALAVTGEIDDSLQELRRLNQSGKLTVGGLIATARMLIVQNMRQAPSDRKWEEVERVLDEAEKASPDAVDIPILRAETLAARDREADAESVLRKALEKNPDETRFRTALISLAERQKDWEKAETLLRESQEAAGDTVELRLMQAQQLVRRKGQEAGDELRKLAENVDQFSDKQRVSLWSSLVTAAMHVNDAEQVKLLCQRIVKADPKNVQARYLLFEQAFLARDEAGMKDASREIEKVAGRGAFWLYAQAVLLSVQAENEEDPSKKLQQALKYLAQAREERPSWSRIPLLEAGIHEQQSQTDSALTCYLKAIEMGEHSPGAMRRAVQLLYQAQRYDEADKLIQGLEEQQVLFSPEMNRAGAEVALRQGDFDRALEMARKAASTESTTYQENLWLGQMLGIVGRRAKAEERTEEAEQLLRDAEKALRRAVEIAPETPATWVSLIRFLGANEAKEQAEEMIEQAGKNIPEEQAPLALAQCYEAIKEPEKAAEEYQAALAAKPNDSLVVRSVASFYYRTGKPVPAEALLRRVIDGKVKVEEADIIWARRQLALILVARGGYPNIQKARELIEQNLTAENVSVMDRRVKASLDARDPKRSRRDDAIGVLEDMVREESAAPEDLFELAQMYDATGSWVKASTMYRNLIASHGNEPRYLATYIIALLRHGEISAADTYVSLLEQAHPNNIITVGLRAEVLVARDDPEKAIELLDAFLDNSEARPSDRDARVRLVAEKYQQLAHQLTKREQDAMAKRFSQQAEGLYRSYVGQDPKREWVLAAFLARQRRIDEALELLDRASNSTNPTVLSQISSILLRSTKMDEEQVRQLSRLLDRAMEQHGRSAQFLMVMADINMRQARHADAERLYREILRENSGHAFAMNNLAVLLALQGIKRDEALELMDQAIEIAGPIGAMLDSRASVYMSLNEPKKALDDLEEALADAETPVRLFHQAQAHEQAGQKNFAAASMEKAVEKGLTKEMLQPLEYPAYGRLSRLLEKR